MSVCCEPFSRVLVLSSFAVYSLDCTIQLLLIHLQLGKVASCTHAMSVLLNESNYEMIAYCSTLK